MPRLKDFFIPDFAGGLVTNRSEFALRNNQAREALNIDFSDPGRTKRRLGSQSWGQFISGLPIIDESFLYTRYTLGSSSESFHLLIDRDSSATVYQVVGDYAIAAVASGAATISVNSSFPFEASGSGEIGGEAFTYTGKAVGQLTGVNGIFRDHKVFTPVNQIQEIGTPNMSTLLGAYFAVLGNVLFITGGEEKYTFDGANFTLVNDVDAPAGLFAEVYRQRVYVAGSGTADAIRQRNGDPRRVSFSDPGDSTSWDVNNYFDVEDTFSEPISGLREYKDVLGVFKYNSIFTYDEVQLKQRIRDVGAWNNRVIQRIDDLLYTFCANGVFATNLFSAQLLSEPVEAYLKQFKPQFDSVSARVVQNTWSAQIDGKYMLYIGDITEPETLEGVVLVYDTRHKTWSVWSGYTDLANFSSLQAYNSGDATAGTSGELGTQFVDSVWGLGDDTTGLLWKFFNNRYLDAENPRVYHGGDFESDFINGADFHSIPIRLMTKFFDIGTPQLLKTFDLLIVFLEEGNVDLAYRLDKGGFITDWMSMGNIKGATIVRELKPDRQGYRIQFRLSGNNVFGQTTLMGILLQNINTKEEIRRSLYG